MHFPSCPPAGTPRRFVGVVSALCCVLAVVANVATWTPAAAAAGERPIFAWIDAQGTLHATNKLADVPEPYASTYQARLDAVARAQQAAAHSGQQVRTPPSPAASSPSPAPAPLPKAGAAQAEGDARASWQARALRARNALVDASLRLQQAEAALAAARHNPVLAQLPAGKAQVAEAELQVAKARREALAARRLLLTDLPTEARARHVPPQWLR